MSEIPKWDDLGLPSLNQLGNRLGYGGSRNCGSILGFLGDEHLDDCVLDLFDTVMWRACSTSQKNEISLDTVVQIIHTKFQEEGERERRIRMSLLDNGSNKKGASKIAHEKKRQELEAECSVWEVFTYNEIKRICEALIKPAEMNSAVKRNTEAESMLQHVFEDTKKRHRRGLRPMIPRYYKIQSVAKHCDTIKKLNPNDWYVFKEVPWREDTMDFIQLIPHTKLIKYMYSIRNPDLMSTIAGFWWNDRKQTGLYKTEVGKRIIEQHGCLARYLIRTFENEEEHDTALARQMFKDILLRGFFDAVFVQICKGPVTSMAVCWLCLNYPCFIDFDLLRAMYHSGECENWFVLNEENQCIQHAVGNHNRWDESTASEDSDYEETKRSGFFATYKKDLDSRVYAPDYSQDKSNFEKILTNEVLNEGSKENNPNEAIQAWIAKGVWESAHVSKTSYRDQKFGSEIIAEDNESCMSSLAQTKTKTQLIPEIKQNPVTKTRYTDLSEEMSDLHISPQRHHVKTADEISPNSRPTLLSSTDERSNFGESSVQYGHGNYPQVILNRQKVEMRRPTGGYFNAPRSAALQNNLGTESERSEFGESTFDDSAILSNQGRDSRRGVRRSRPGNRSMLARGSYKSPSPRENHLTNQASRSDFGNSAAEAKHHENLPSNMPIKGPQNFNITRQTGESAFYNSGTQSAANRRGRGSSIAYSGASYRGRGRPQRTQTSITAASLALNSTAHRR